jgi:hypothetical protein
MKEWEAEKFFFNGVEKYEISFSLTNELMR